MQNRCKPHAFFKAIRGNWRNAVYVSCNQSHCPYGHNSSCKGFLLTTNEDGHPLILSEEDYIRLTNESIDPSECAGMISRYAFMSMYNLFIQWHMDSPADCPLYIIGRQMIGNCR